MLGVPTTVRSRRKCRDCRRPDGVEILAHRDGHYAIPFHERSVAVVRPDGWPVTDEATIATLLDRKDWRIVRVELDDEDRCKRCAYVHRNPDSVPAMKPPEHTYNGAKPKWRR